MENLHLSFSSSVTGSHEIWVLGLRKKPLALSARARVFKSFYTDMWYYFCLHFVLSIYHPIIRLIINFIVPWGNFQAYLIRPDADEGPFVSRHENRPSEKAWREFMDGTTVSVFV